MNRWPNKPGNRHKAGGARPRPQQTEAERAEAEKAKAAFLNAKKPTILPAKKART